MLIKYLTALFVVLAISCLTPCKAQVTATFIGNGAISTNANWSGGSKPSDPDTEITIASGKTMVVDQNFTCKTLRINTGASFSCNGGILTVTEGIYDKNGVKRIAINSSLQISSSIQVDEQTSGTFTDARDGQLYPWVKIGTQVWMAKNLAYLPAVVEPGTGSRTVPYYYVYGYDGTVVADAKATANYATYGVLYNWAAAMDGATSSSANPSGVQGVCPAGWHLPSYAEWTELKDFLTSDGHSGTEGTALKATSGWAGGGNGTDDYGFSGLPGGHRTYDDGSFYSVTENSLWWSSMESYTDTDCVWNLALDYGNSNADLSENYKDHGFSVRCVRD